MNTIDPALLEPSPTVLEIYGFTNELTQTLRELFVTSLQQPSYVSRAIIKSSSASKDNPTARVESMTLTCPFGLALRLAQSYGQYVLEELPPCCLQQQKAEGCLYHSFPSEGLDSIYLHPNPTDDHNEAIDFYSYRAQKVDPKLLERIEAAGVDVFSAMIISQELANLISEIISFNEFNGFLNNY